VLIDPSYSPEAFVQRASDQGLTVTHVIAPGQIPAERDHLSADR
jgi:hypothetical protein